MPILHRSSDRKREPKAITQFIEKGHPLLAFAVTMSWLWRGVVGAAFATLLAAWLG